MGFKWKKIKLMDFTTEKQKKKFEGTKGRLGGGWGRVVRMDFNL